MATDEKRSGCLFHIQRSDGRRRPPRQGGAARRYRQVACRHGNGPKEQRLLAPSCGGGAKTRTARPVSEGAGRRCHTVVVRAAADGRPATPQHQRPPRVWNVSRLYGSVRVCAAVCVCVRCRCRSFLCFLLRIKWRTCRCAEVVQVSGEPCSVLAPFARGSCSCRTVLLSLARGAFHSGFVGVSNEWMKRDTIFVWITEGQGFFCVCCPPLAPVKPICGADKQSPFFVSSLTRQRMGFCVPLNGTARGISADTTGIKLLVLF